MSLRVSCQGCRDHSKIYWWLLRMEWRRRISTGCERCRLSLISVCFHWNWAASAVGDSIWWWLRWNKAMLLRRVFPRVRRNYYQRDLADSSLINRSWPNILEKENAGLSLKWKLGLWLEKVNSFWCWMRDSWYKLRNLLSPNFMPI
jgi:hypothetical protein